VTARCPKCGEERDVQVWRSINVGLDPEARRQLLAGHVNVYECGKCGGESLIDVDLLYHDPELELAVQYYPYERLGDDGFLSNFTPAGELAMELPGGAAVRERAGYLLRPHVVFDMGELVRYVAFRERLYELATGREPHPDE
jgi:Zn ribbon nucleic-acid-binding protein